MDKTIYYEIEDTSLDQSQVLLKISTKGFPIEESIEYDYNGNWVESLNSDYDENFQIRLTKLLDDNNIRLIMDLLEQDDVYYNDKYKLRITVKNLEIVDNY